MTEVAIVMGSDSDLPVMKEAAEFLDEIGVGYTLTIVSAHRTPDRLHAFGKTAEEKGYKVIIAGAGGAAHLPGMVAAYTPLPVIGVPIKTKSLAGMDSLYSIVQMPPGVPVATVAINGARNAGILAAEILGTHDKSLRHKITSLKSKIGEEVIKKATKLEKIQYKKYLKSTTT